MMSKTLYVSDLDGTLLRNDQTLSSFTTQTLNRLIEKGLLFSYATARSNYSASKITSALQAQIPVIVYNGTFILENQTQKPLLSNTFSKEEGEQILSKLLRGGIYPVVYSFLGGRETFSYRADRQSRGTKLFLDQHRGDERERPVFDDDALFAGDLFHFSCIDEPEKLLPIYEQFKEAFSCVYYREAYTNEQWLEIHPKAATKANAILELKRLLNCDRVICFGDGKNDLSMFAIADECYAVENAAEELKAIATGIIDCNDQDGVAKWLLAQFEKRDFKND